MNTNTNPINPFPGLRPFTQEEDYLFFGREEQTIELLQRLGGNRFVAVVGTSGSGKSSLVRCGLLSELLGGKMLQAGAAWEIAVTHPGGNPMALLAEALVEADLYDGDEENVRENLLATLSRSHFGLVEAVKQSELGEDTNFLLVVDQFEEIFRFNEAGQMQQEVANEFVSILLEAVAQSEVPIYVVLTMRSDFIGECGQFEGLAEMVNRGEFLIPRLNREQYKRVIEGPIKVAGGQITPRLLQRLLNDLGQQGDQLPCLQHALMRTWNVWTENDNAEALDLDDYQRVGRMTQALSLHADEIYDSLETDRQRELCEGIFQALTVQESENRGIRRPQRLGRLCRILDVDADELLPIIDAYRQSGVTFLMPSAEVELNEQTIIDISHESLMRVWTRLRHWVDEEAQSAGIYLRLSESAALYGQQKAGLYRDPELGIALAWRESQQPNSAWAERYQVGFEDAISFLDSSQQASVAEERAREAARQKELQQAQRLTEIERQRATDQARSAVRLRRLVRGLGVVAMVAVTAGVFAWLARQEARQNADVALQAQRETEIALTEVEKKRDQAEAAETAALRAQQKTAETLTVVEAQQAELKAAKELAERNLKTAEIAEAEARAAEVVALAAEKRSREFRYATDIQLAAVLIADEATNASQVLGRLADHDPAESDAPQEDDLRGFEWHFMKRLVDGNAGVFSGYEQDIVDCALSPAGELVTLDDRAQLRRWDGKTLQEAGPAFDLGKDRNVGHKALSRNGQLAAIVVGKQVFILDTTNGAEIAKISTAAAGGLIFSPDSRILFTADVTIGWWNATTGKPISTQSVKGALERPGPLSISADGLTVAVGEQGASRNAFSIFRMNRSSTEVSVLRNKQSVGGTMSTLALSPDGQSVAVSNKF